MIQYTPASQLQIQEFKTPFQLELDANNRWVKLSQIIPWDDLARVYYSGLKSKKGRAALGARIAIGAMVIKHRLNYQTARRWPPSRKTPICSIFWDWTCLTPSPYLTPVCS